MKNFMYESLLVLLCLCMMLTVVGCSKEETKDKTKKNVSLSTGTAYTAQGKVGAMDLVASAGNYDLLMDPTLKTIAVRVKSTGYIWKSNLDQAQVKTTIERLEKEFAAKGDTITLAESDYYENMSQITLTYYDASNKPVVYNSYQYAVLEDNVETYSIANKGVNTGVRVVYHIGPNVDDQLVPAVLTKEDMDALLAKMDEYDRETFLYNYEENVYDNMDKTTLESFKLENKNFKSGDTYYMLATTAKRMKAQMYQDYLSSTISGFSDLTPYYEHAGRDYDPPDIPRFTVAVDYTISKNGLKVNVPTDKIQFEEGSFRLHQLQVLPYFGTITDGSPATILLPDGSGALIDANLESEAAVTLPFYGADNSLYTGNNKQAADNAKSMQQATLPVFGVANGANGYVTYVSDGESVGSVECHPIYSYYRPYARVGGTFTVHPFEIFNSNGAAATTNMQKYADAPYTGNITLDYMFITGTDVDYVDMAKAVRTKIFSGTKQTVKDSDVRFYLETYGNVKRKESVLGYAYNKDVALTTVEQARTMYDNLTQNGITNVAIRYNNWYGDEYVNKISKIGKVSDSIASKKEFEEFIKYVGGNGAAVYPNVELVMEAYSTSLSDATWHAKFIDGTMVNYSDSALYTAGVTTTVDRLVVKGDEILKKLPGIVDDLTDLSIESVALSTVGDQMFSDFTEEEIRYRDGVQEDMVSIMQQIKDSGKSILVDAGNAYALPYASDIMNISLGYSNLSFEKMQVPFLQIVLHGKVSYAGDSMNLADNYDIQLLRTVEYGANMAYTLNYAQADMVKNTNYSELYSTNYDHWIETALADYKKVAKVLDGCQNSTIEDHTTLASGVYMTTYANGVNIVVNYNDADYNYNGTVIKAKDFARVTVQKGGVANVEQK